MTKVSVVYHSGIGHTKVIAEAVVRGAKQVLGTISRKVASDLAAAKAFPFPASSHR